MRQSVLSRFFTLAVLFTAYTALALEKPYPVTILSATIEKYSLESNVLHVVASVDNGFSSHSEDWSVSVADNNFLTVDPSGDELIGSFTLDFIIPSASDSAPISVTCSACSDTACLLPQTFSINAITSVTQDEARNSVSKYKFTSADGYMDAEEFVAFLKGETNSDASLAQKNRNIFLLFIAFIFAGIALNFTPCVLPMIPVQLAILGIGANRTTKTNGFKRGLAYGLGMAIAYGALGLVLVLTGGFFGTIQSSPWFSLSVGAVFILLALSLLDVFPIDFSHFGHSAHSLASTVAVFLMGCGTALLAGTCVAPAVIAAFVLSGAMYASGSAPALALPFALGIGMGLPWPFIGAGIATLPRPGKWMKWVKIIMAAAVLVVASFYFIRSYHAFRGDTLNTDSIDAADGIDSVSARIDTAVTVGKPVLLDFQASWCSSCAAMEKSVFHSPEVAPMLEKFTIIKIQAEDPSAAPVKTVLSAFDVHGLPAYRIIR